MRAIRIQARYIIANANQILHPGQVVIMNGRVVEVTRYCVDRPDIDLGGRVILPGMVNPHTHLEFSGLSTPFSKGHRFPDWIASVIAYRRQRDAGLDQPQIETQLRTAVGQGLKESYSCGVAALCDIVTIPWSHTCLPSEPSNTPSVIPAIEQIGLNDARAEQCRRWRQKIELANNSYQNESLLELAYSPHAPYSTQWPLICEVVNRAVEHGRLVVMHVAESLDELQWLGEGTGPFKDAFERLGIEVSSLIRPSIDQAIDQLGRAPRALLVHGNYLTEDQIHFTGQFRDRIHIVYTPRTHSYFEHAVYPLNEFRQAGLNVVFGTDSRASNPDLNLWLEARHALAKHKNLSPADAFQAVTFEAARALGIDDRFGSIKPGCRAAMCVATEPPSSVDSERLVEWLLTNVERIEPLSKWFHSCFY